MIERPRALPALTFVAALLTSTDDQCGRACADDVEKPLTVDRSLILPGDVTYVVEGRMRIPKGVTVTIQKDTKLVGRKDSVLEVEGELEIHGVGVAHVPVTDVVIELQGKFGGVHLDMVDFVGKSAVVTPKDKPADGRVFLENTELKDTATIDVEMNGNAVYLHRVRSSGSVRVKGVDRQGSAGNKVQFVASNCCPQKGPFVQGRLMGEIAVENVSEVTVRACNLTGEKVSFTDCDVVAFDGNYVGCKSLEFVQSTAGRFAKTAISKCDFQGVKIVTYAPRVEGKEENLTLERCWFDGETGTGTIRDRFVRDRSRDPKCGVLVGFKKIEAEPLGLAGAAKK